MNKQLPMFLRSRWRSSWQVAIATGILSAIAARPVRAIPINCSEIYFSDPGTFGTPSNPTTVVDGGLYTINTTTGADTLVGRFPNSTSTAVNEPANGYPNQNRAGGTVAIIGGATPTAYTSSDTFARAGANLQSFDGTTGANLPNAKFTARANGLATAPNGMMHYLARNGNTQQIYKFASLNSASVLVGTVTPPVGDTIFNTLDAGDNAFDSNGRHYYFASVNGSGNTGYLYYIDPSLNAHLLGSVSTPGGATGLAFDGAGNLYTSSQGKLDKVTMTNGFGVITIVGTPAHAIVDLASCAFPSVSPLFNFTDGIVKQVRNVTTNQPLTNQNTGVTGHTLEYQITINNSGNLPSDNTKFYDLIPTGTSYVAGSTKMCNSTGTTCTAVADLTGGVAPFTTTGGMLVNTAGQAAGIVNAGVTSEVIVKFQVKVTATTGSVQNTGILYYPVANAGTFLTSSIASSPVKTTLSVAVSGTVWNDVDLSGKSGGTIFTTGESGTNANSSSFYAYLVDATNQTIASSPISATNGTYNFPVVLPNQTGLKIELSTTPPPAPLPSTTVPTPSIPTGWKNTAPIVIPAVNIGLVDIPNADFGIVRAANAILVKRITAIKAAGTATWVRTANPNDSTPLNTVVHTTANDAATINWPATSYLVGAVNAGKIKPGDELEYTIYYLNSQGANVTSLKICDPIRGSQTYTPGSMQLLPGNAATPISLTDGTDGADRASSYTAGNAPTDCNAGGSTILTGTRDNGGVAIQLTGTGATKQPDLAAIPSATAPNTPTNSYGWFRFTTKVDP